MHNARSLEKAGAAVVVPQDDLTGEALWSVVQDLLAHPERLAGMSRAARSLARPEAAAEIAADLDSFLPPPGAAR
jgi:UDP-N-acetylglucosamine--N-acetylmuramyl-(pentapeptide) pyrophosphoryl-undecaprenol N-acetylglucosamine transferase